MNHLKTILILFCLTGFSTLSVCQLTGKNDYTLKIEEGETIKKENKTVWVIPTTLTNHTKDTLKYFSMLCSWDEYYLVSEKAHLKIDRNHCKKNFPVTTIIAPKESRTVKIKLQVIDTLNMSNIKFRIGMNLIRAKKSTGKYPEQTDYLDDNKKGIIIWSNEMIMKL